MLKQVVVGLSGLLALAMVACSGVAGDQSFGIQQRSSSWSTRIDSDEQTKGIADGSLTHVEMKSGTPPGVTLAFWIDVGGGHGSGVGRSGIATYDMEFKGRNGSPLEIHAETTDGSTASVTIGKKEFNDVKDSLFLIATDADKVRIKKLKLDNKFPKTFNDVDGIVKYALDTKAIREFWENTETKASSSEE